MLQTFKITFSSDRAQFSAAALVKLVWLDNFVISQVRHLNRKAMLALCWLDVAVAVGGLGFYCRICDYWVG